MTTAPLPVTIVVVPVLEGDRFGLLVVRRAVPPGIGKLAFVSGFLEAEPWRIGAAREVREETGIVLDPATLSPLTFDTTAPNPSRILLFALAAPIDAGALPEHRDAEVSERGLIYGPDGLDEIMVYPHHVAIARAQFAARGITGPHAFASK